MPSARPSFVDVSRECAQTSLALIVKNAQLSAVSVEGDGLKNRRLFAFLFRFLNRPSEKRAQCAQECAQTGVPKTSMRRRYKARLWLYLAPKATV